MKNKKKNVFKNLIIGALVFCFLFYVGFGSLILNSQKNNIDANAIYVTHRLNQLQLNLEAASIVYTNAFGDNDSKTMFIDDLYDESTKINSYDELNTFVSNVMELKKYITFSDSANKHQQKVLTFVLFITNKLHNGVVQFDEKVSFYNGASKMFPGMNSFFPINITYLEL